MSRSIIITRRDWVSQPIAKISGGNWITPFNDLIDPRPQTVLQALSPDPVDTTFDIDFGTIRQNVGLFHFQGLGVTAGATLRLQVGIDPTFVDNIFDTNVIAAWPRDKLRLSTGPWGEFTIDGIMDPDEYAAFGMTRFIVPDVPLIAQYVRVKINDSAAAVPARIGYFGACETWTPINGTDFGWRMTVVDDSEITTVPGGSRYFIVRNKRRRLDLGFSAIPHTEVIEKVYGWLAYVGKTVPIAIVLFPDEEVHATEKQGVWGTLVDDVSLTNPYFATHSMPLSLEQLI